MCACTDIFAKPSMPQPREARGGDSREELLCNSSCGYYTIIELIFQFAFAYCQQAQIRFLADLRLLSFAFQFAAKAFAVSAPSSS